MTTAAPTITCRQLYDVVTDYLDGTLPPDDRVEFDRHIRVCPSCQSYLDGYRRTIALGQAAYASDQADHPAKAPAGVLDAVRAALARTAHSPATRR